VSDYSGYGYDDWSSGVAYGADDPLFGAMPGTEETRTEETHSYTPAHGTGQEHGYGQKHGYGQWSGYGTSHSQTRETGPHTVYGDMGLHQQVQTVEAGAYAPGTGTFGTGTLGTGTFESETFGTGTFGTGTFGAVSYQTGTYAIGDAGGTAACDAETRASGAAYEPAAFEPETYEPETYEPETYEPGAQTYGPEPDPKPAPDPGSADAATATVPRSRAANRGGNRRRRPAKRSALLGGAVPSVAVVGVAACAAAAVAVTSDSDEPTSTQADGTSASTAAVSSRLDRQLAGVSRNADEFADRASRTQERLDLKERQAAERHRKAAEAARREALRPKFFLPVAQQGLSAYFGQAGVNWMSVHTGIDFPVGYGTPVRAATDGTVRTQWNPSYGNMAIVTSADGTETWYCHLSTTRIRSGSVKAGDVIAYSGNSGNSTGPHLHFEVHPGGDAAIDPLNWLLAKGLDPR
jgi:murein DD-endopeptidase MepM/ murein hydrolase activator NlpD